MKKSKTIYQTTKNASKLHKRILELIAENNFFANYEIRQEYSVSEINPSYKSNKEKFDIVILGLKVIIEIMGEQHYKPCCFGGITLSEATRRFKAQQKRDAKKKSAAEEAGWAYVIVRYDEKKITSEELSNRIKDALLKIQIDNSNQKLEELKKSKLKAKIQNKSFQKSNKRYSWPKKKIPSRKFNQEQS